MDFTKTLIWVQVHVLLSNQLNSANIKVIGNFIDDFIKVDLAQDGLIVIPHFLRIRTLLDINKQLSIGFRCKRQSDTLHWASFQYEKLPDFCLLCSIIGHMGKNYPREDLQPSVDTSKDCRPVDTSKDCRPPFGPWLKAFPRPKNLTSPPKNLHQSRIDLACLTPLQTSYPHFQST